MKIILLNGPPRSGKDTAAGMLQEILQQSNEFVGQYKFATVLKDTAHRMYGLDVPTDHFENVKEEKRAEFFGLTPRQVYIEVSERYFKTVHGDDIFGKLLLQQLRHEAPQVALISDSGFMSEALVLIEEFGADNVSLFRFHREGSSFRNDSRNYLTIYGVKTVDVQNSGSKQDLFDSLQKLVTVHA